MAVEMKWYIFDENNHPVGWADGDECPACEFDTEKDAQMFLGGILDLDPFIAEEFAEATVKECIFFYDDGKRNMSGLIPVANGDNVELKEWR